MSAPAEVVAHLSSAPSVAWLAGAPAYSEAAPELGDRYPTLVDDAIAWIHAARGADERNETVSTLPLRDFLR